MALGSVDELAITMQVSEVDGNLLVLGSQLTVSQQLVYTYLGYDPEQTSYTEYLTTRGTLEVALGMAGVMPVTAVTSVYVDESGAFGQSPTAFADAALVAGTDYMRVLNTSGKITGLRRINTVWPFTLYRNAGDLVGLRADCPGCVKVTYTVDNSRVLFVAINACYMEAAARYRAIPFGIGTLTSDSMDGASVSVTPGQRGQQAKDEKDNFLSPYVAQMLRPFSLRRFI
jgi:hypothetical protein